jgi:hypothetical protein
MIRKSMPSGYDPMVYEIRSIAVYLPGVAMPVTRAGANGD